MISYLKGRIILSNDNSLILETGGIGYKIFLTKQYNADGEKSFYIHEVIREDMHDLYGFEKYEELLLFEKLISVNGVGPKAGMAIMSSASSEKIISAIISEDLTFFYTISGIGKKAAAKIILDLKPKISGLEGGGVIGKMDQSDEVVDALCSLGYKKAELGRVISSIPENLKTSEEKVRWCLSNLAKS